jgi:hypothetical protein
VIFPSTIVVPWCSTPQRVLALMRQNGTKGLPSHSRSDARETRRTEILGFGCYMCEYLLFDIAKRIDKSGVRLAL